MKLITFLGANTPAETLYRLNESQAHLATACGIALARFLPETMMRVFVTEGAYKTNYAAFAAQVEDHVADLAPVFIADGNDEAQMWEIFQRVIENVDDEEEVVFDITHGFRSLPFIAFLAAAYLREVKRARIHKVYYGNYEARDKSVSPSETPILDLTHFVTLLDWIKATDRFTRTGDSADMGRLLEAEMPREDLSNATLLEREAAGKRARLWRQSATAHTVDNLKRLSLALQLDRAYEAMTLSAQLQATLANAVRENAQFEAPFAPLVQQVADAYEPIALTNPQGEPLRALATERNLIFWCIERGQLMQAVAMAREWLITWVMVQNGEDDVLNKESRHDYEMGITARLRRQEGSQATSSARDLSATLRIEQVADIYQKLGGLRNSMMHAWKSPNQMHAQTALENIKKYSQFLNDLPLPAPKDGHSS